MKQASILGAHMNLPRELGRRSKATRQASCLECEDHSQASQSIEREPDTLEKASKILRELALVLNIDEETIFVQSEKEKLFECARHIYKARQASAEIFGDSHISSGPAWDILLDLYISQETERDVSVTDATLAAGCPASTGLRWIQVLQDQGLVTRLRDCSDNRRIFLMLTEQGQTRVRDALRAHRLGD